MGSGYRRVFRDVQPSGDLTLPSGRFPPAVLDRSKQAATPSAGQQRGGGLGLAITRRIVQLHGGTLAIASEPLHGTVVSINLPAGESPED